MSVIDLVPPMPDLGPVKIIPHPKTPGEMMVNIAGVVRIARDAKTLKSLRFYRAFCSAWDQLQGAEGSTTAKQTEAMRLALAKSGKSLHFFDLQP